MTASGYIQTPCHASLADEPRADAAKIEDQGEAANSGRYPQGRAAVYGKRPGRIARRDGIGRDQSDDRSELFGFEPNARMRTRNQTGDVRVCPAFPKRPAFADRTRRRNDNGLPVCRLSADASPVL